MIIWSEKDPIFTRTYRERLERSFPHHHTTVLPGVGHFGPSDAPAEFRDAITDWWDETLDPVATPAAVT